jgi:hypothetical protein
MMMMMMSGGGGVVVAVALGVRMSVAGEGAGVVMMIKIT